MRVRNWGIAAASVSLALTAFALPDQGVLGLWRTPTGSVIRSYSCGSAVCLKIVQIEKDATGSTDSNNPDASLRSRALCDLVVGDGFKPDAGATKAEDGRLYDPKVGKTYSGSMVANGNTLKLRGYLGVKLFGRSEEWTRVAEPVTACVKR